MSSQSQLRLIINEFSRKFQTKLNTQKLHSFVTKSQLARDPYFATQLVRYYSLNDDLISARKLFDVFPERSVFLWNSVIRAHAKSPHQLRPALSLFSRMLSSDTTPDSFTYACLARGLSEGSDTEGLRCIHGNAIVSGLGFDLVCGSTLVKAYSKAGLTFEASKLFFSVAEPDVPLWNAMLSGYGSCEGGGVNMFNLMLRQGNRPDCYTMVALMTGVIDPGLISVARSVHGFCMKVGLDSHSYVGSALVSMYSRCKCIASACGAFSSISEPTDLVACSSLINGYSKCGYHKEALCLFNELRMSGKKPDCVLVAIVLGSCAELSDSLYGQEVHSYVIRQGLELDMKVSSALIDMYSKCGILDSAMALFAKVPEKSVVSFNSVILGLGLHGFASSAFEKFNEMLEMGLKPDEVTFSALLCTCCHSGLLYEGQEMFMRMKSEFGVEPRTEHHVYIVKLMGMAGKLEEAFEFVMSLRRPIDSGIWGALLSCCEVHEDAHLAEVVAAKIRENEEEERRRRGVYDVMLSNVYARYGKWDEAEMLRDGVSESFGGKLPGISWV